MNRQSDEQMRTVTLEIRHTIKQIPFYQTNQMKPIRYQHRQQEQQPQRQPEHLK